MIEAEERRAAQTASNLNSCTAVINGVENALSALANEGNRQYVDAMKAQFRAAVAQHMTMGPGVLPNLPPCPPRQASNVTFGKTLQLVLQADNMYRFLNRRLQSQVLNHHGPQLPREDIKNPLDLQVLVAHQLRGPLHLEYQ